MLFLRELKRRRVLRTASLYVLAAWVALQVVEVLSNVGLPPSTMRNLLVIVSIGFPVVLVVGWYYDISREGIVRTPPRAAGETLPNLNLFDHLLLAGLVAVVAVDAWILSMPPVADATQSATDPVARQRTIAVLAFEDLGPSAEGEDIGESLADELRASLTRIAGLRVLGPETSRALGEAGEGRIRMADELRVTTLLLGGVMLDGDRLRVDAQLVGVPTGNPLWSAEIERPVAEAVDLQDGLIRQVVNAVAPGLDPDPAQHPRAESGACAQVFDLYLRGKQLSKARRQSQAVLYQRGMQLLREAVAIDGQCALAWEAIAVGELDWTTPGRAKAAAAARRALEINDALPEAWTVLAEIAEEEARWDQAEDYFLRALYADPTNAHANIKYGDALATRGRNRDALHYALEAYRYEPASSNINFLVAYVALAAGESDLTLKHAEISREISGDTHAWVWDLIAEAHLQKGEVERALDAYAREGDALAPWMPDCVRARQQPALAPGVVDGMRETLGQYKAGLLTESQAWNWIGGLLRCSIWLAEPDLVFEALDVKGVPPFEEGTPTEAFFANMFWPDAAVLRQHPRFRRVVVESGLLDYWNKWGWADACRPDGDSFRCD